MNLLQRIRARYFEATDNTGAPCSLGATYQLGSKAIPVFDPLTASTSELAHQAWAKAHVLKNGSITLKDIRDRGCNSPAKVVFRLRELGVIAPKSQDTWEKGNGRFKRYWRSGVVGEVSRAPSKAELEAGQRRAA